MADPYRDPDRACPACNSTLREFRSRLVCDACDGMFLALPDLGEAIRELTGVVPAFEYRDEAAGKRSCPHCREKMTTCKLQIGIDEEVVKPKPELDRCATHGLWFDGEELAKVFQKVIGKGPGGGVDRKIAVGGGGVGPRPSMASGGWRGRSGVPEWWGGGGGGEW